ncbi:LOW QUALITY PROTEIN: CCN family member 1 [Manacus vitellinus]|nr:LOW QUALITY PROTEIN: CCN family member 1 [Manacus vitellinus]
MFAAWPSRSRSGNRASRCRWAQPGSRGVRAPPAQPRARTSASRYLLRSRGPSASRREGSGSAAPRAVSRPAGPGAEGPPRHRAAAALAAVPEPGRGGAAAARASHIPWDAAERWTRRGPGTRDVTPRRTRRPAPHIRRAGPEPTAPAALSAPRSRRSRCSGADTGYAGTRPLWRPLSSAWPLVSAAALPAAGEGGRVGCPRCAAGAHRALRSAPQALGSPCPAVCQCPAAAPQCAPGGGACPDGCGCCKVCAKQLNEDCSRSQPCDHTKGLECNFGASPAALKGICRAQSEGRPCEYNSKIYQNGESFQPNCKHQCTCIDGAVGCIPLCPQELSLPNLGCPSPRLVKVPGQCCEEWVCDESKDALEELEGFFSKEFGPDDSEGELTRNNELIAIVKGGLKMLPVFGSEPQSRAFENPKCIVQTTSWSQCSKTCGTGISTRVTNDNADCKLIKETRICEVRPCGQPSYASLKKGKKCTKTRKSPSPVKFTYAGCSSVKKYRPKYCGSCVDGRCCTPQQTRTVKVRFRCDDGETFTKSVMMIQSCRCNYNCPHANEAYPFYRLVNDIHKFRD